MQERSIERFLPFVGRARLSLLFVVLMLLCIAPILNMRGNAFYGCHKYIIVARV
jgi:hypothetical protein